MIDIINNMIYVIDNKIDIVNNPVHELTKSGVSRISFNLYKTRINN